MRGSNRLRCACAASLLAFAACRGAPSARPEATQAARTPPATSPGSGVPGDPERGPPAPSADERGHVPLSMLGGSAPRVDRALRRYAGDHAGRLPTSIAALLGESDLDGTPYLREEPRDVWGRPLSYAVLSARYGVFELRSFGPDGVPATADDLVAVPDPVPFD